MIDRIETRIETVFDSDNTIKKLPKALYGTVANQTFRRTFRNLNFFETHVHLGTLTFQKNLNHKNFLENFDLRQCLYTHSS